MKSLATSLLVFCIALLALSWTISADTLQNFVECVSHNSPNPSSISKIIYTSSDSSYLSVLNFSIHNLRFTLPSTPKPLVIVTPLNESQVFPFISCSKAYGMQIRVRSGGHDYEGLSYVSQVPFIILDLINIRSIEVDLKSKTAWVQAGATVGELYYSIVEKSGTLSFPAGICPTVGVGGHFSGGGYGSLLRKYGLAADNIIDARMYNANGTLLDRKSMGEDLFWAIRGGGGGSFGVILAWKVNLVSVPSTVTVFNVRKTLEQNATNLIYRWQYVASKFPKELFIRITIGREKSSEEGKFTILASFISLYLGRVDDLIHLMQDEFPELGLTKDDCIELSWIQSIFFFYGWNIGEPLKSLQSRSQHKLHYFKSKSDYVQEPIPISGLEGMLNMFFEDGAGESQLVLNPYGGRMDEISKSSIPFPHRAGNLYKIGYTASWDEASTTVANSRIDWIRRLYKYMEPYVSKNPRAAYINYRDLDIGANMQHNTSYEQASIWGVKYFKNNFKKLAKIKSQIDPSNFFWNEQSIPA
ncbi:cannabidiolic acid synthase-like 1 [Impatiens glandulifera]|uniref:cannabidiolic acid synthase-like 1 n=1 Tax=Impatiens glandulifera TaxID=253017 RepID=UPI001FB0D95D|nr:cannabidiolic acid synthase-like 1 [Impatiens glandulifera]